MKGAFVFLNLIGLAAFLCMFGGGYLARTGYYFLAAFFIASVVLFPKQAFSAYFSRDSILFYIFLLFVFITGRLAFNFTAAQFIIFSFVLVEKFQITLLDTYPALRFKQVSFFKVQLLIILFFCIAYILYVRFDPMAARRLVSTDKDDSIAIGGGFGMPYSLCLLIPYLIYLLKQKLSRPNKTIVLALLVLGIYLIIRSSFVIAMVVMMLGLSLAVLARFKPVYRVIGVVAALLLIVPLYQLLPSVVSSLNSASVIASRFEEMDMIFYEGDLSQASDLSVRLELAFSSLKAFFDNPFMGIGREVGYDYFDLFDAGIGGHCEWFDILGRYGLFALLLVYFLFKNRPVKTLGAKISFVVFLLIGFLNPLFIVQIIIMIFYIIPMSDYLEEKTGFLSK